ncbi:T9SS type A sorting domain-containing protein [bacterium SCSIO 12741]|nr:T9SS type A sorting domain-containing protein [bacterium SCSIO 12741]
MEYAGSHISDLSIVSTGQGDGYIIAGTENLSQAQKHIVVFKVDLMGNMVWQWRFDDPNGTKNARAFDIIRRQGQGDTYIITGYCNSTAGYKQVLALEIIDQGNSCMQGPNTVQIPVQSSDAFTGFPLRNAVGVEIINTQDGGFAIAGAVAIDFDDASSKKQLLIKLKGNLQMDWIEEFDFSQFGDQNDFDFANSVVEMTNYTSPSNPSNFVSAYYLAGSKSKRTVSQLQGASGLIVEDNMNYRTTLSIANAWGAPSPTNDYSTDLFYDPVENRVYQKIFTKFSHGTMIAKIDPTSGDLTHYYESNLLNHGNEYYGSKLIESTDGQDFVLTGHANLYPTAMKVGRSNWPQLGTVGTGILQDIDMRQYTSVTLDNPSVIGPDFPSHPPFFSGNQNHFFYVPKHICVSPNGGYMYVIPGEESQGTSINLLKLDEKLITGCENFSSMSPNNQFSPVTKNDPYTNDPIAVNASKFAMKSKTASDAPCSDFCFGDFTLEACEDATGNGVFNLTSSMADLLGSGYTIQWFQDAAMTQAITNPAAYTAANGTQVFAHMVTPDGCTHLVTVTLELIPVPTFGPLTIQADGSGIYNLNSIILQYTSAGQQVQWFYDAAMNQPIDEPWQFASSGSITIYLSVVSPAGCEYQTSATLVCDDVTGSGYWPKQSIGGEAEAITDIEMDANGNAYITGYYYSDFDLMGTTVEYNGQTGGKQFFLAKLNGCAIEWVKVNLDPGPSSGLGLAIAPNGSVYVTGTYGDKIDFDNGVSLTSQGNNFPGYGFIAHYSASGVCQWAKPMILMDYEVFPEEVVVDYGGNNVYVAGYRYSMGFNHNQYFVQAYDQNGAQQWTVDDPNGPGAPSSRAIDIDMDNNGNLVIAGGMYTPGTLNIGGVNITSGTSNEGFVFILDPGGMFQTLAKNNFWPEGLACDASGHTYVTGSHNGSGFMFNGTAQFGPVFLAKFGSGLNEIWATTATTTAVPGNSLIHAGHDVKLNASGEPMITGKYSWNLTFSGVPTLTATSTQSANINYFVAKYATNGSLSWVMNTPTPDFDSPGRLSPKVSMAFDGSTGLSFIAGRFSQSITFGSNSTMFASGPDLFITRVYDQNTSGSYQKTSENALELEEQENQAQGQLLIYPNPGTGQFQLLWPEEAGEFEYAILYDIRGKRVEVPFSSKTSKNEAQIDVSNLPNGVYYLQLTGSEQLYQEKLILQR